jgi:BirA family biotin operon repressor/biotin-[acetyl-CoA-carboxylase] ligase
VELSRRAASAGFSLLSLETIGSTNDEALRLAADGGLDRLWVVAREQTGGRGRHGRSWSSPPGNLYASLLLIDPAPIPAVPQLGFVAGVALVSAVRPLLSNDPELTLKWPNDLLHGVAKVAGILLTGSRLPDGRFACAIGIGVNCASHPAGLPYVAADLAGLGASCGPGDVFEALSLHMALWLERWSGGERFAAVREAWLANAAGVGRPIRVSLGDRSIEGVFETVDGQGRLVVATSSGQRVVEAGDVYFENAHVAGQGRTNGEEQ